MTIIDAEFRLWLRECGIDPSFLTDEEADDLYAIFLDEKLEDDEFFDW